MIFIPQEAFSLNAKGKSHKQKKQSFCLYILEAIYLTVYLCSFLFVHLSGMYLVKYVAGLHRPIHKLTLNCSIMGNGLQTYVHTLPQKCHKCKLSFEVCPVIPIEADGNLWVDLLAENYMTKYHCLFRF